MSRFTDLFQQPEPVVEPTPAPKPVKESAEKAVPTTKASKKKFTLD